MSFPTLIVELGLGSTMFTASPTWTAITSYVRRGYTTRGRSSIDGRFETGTGWLELDNRDGRFNPGNTAGAYSPNLKIDIPVRIRATWDSTTYPVFYGSARAFPPQVIPGGDSIVRMTLADGFYTLNLEDLAGESYSEESTATRIGNVLDDIGWPAGLRDLDSGVATVQATDFAQPNDGGEQPALLHLLDVAESEVGVLFMSREGNVKFNNRVANSGATAAVTFDGDDFSDIKLAFDDSYLWNVFRIAREDGAQIEYDASGSNPRRTLTRDVMPMANDGEALNVAEWLSNIFGEQKQRIESLNFAPFKDTTLGTNILNLELRDYVHVDHTPPGGDAVNDDVSVEKITHEFGKRSWKTTLEVAPLSDFELQDFWILGTSQLGTGTVLA